MTKNQAKWLIKLLKTKGISFEPGLSEEEFNEINQVFELEFPDDLKLFLSLGLPSSFVDWRYGINSDKGKKIILQRMYWPLEGILYDVKFNDFWFEEWEKQPQLYTEQEQIVRSAFEDYPKLIPVYSHRYISSTPKNAGNPVFSVYQTDIIHYGFDLLSYFSNEFKFLLPDIFGKVHEPAAIDFWTKLVAKNNEGFDVFIEEK